MFDMTPVWPDNVLDEGFWSVVLRWNLANYYVMDPWKDNHSFQQATIQMGVSKK